jgi:ssDNA thymidine ADP-ribosyltransferase, DarT
VSDECIHGFVDGLCATCNPKPLPELVTASRPAARSRVAAPPRATVRSLRAAARIPVGSVPADTLLEQRIYHVTHVSNLPGILEQRAIIAGAEPHLDLSPAALREERAEISVPGSRELRLTDFVPFFLSPDAGLWQSLRSGHDHPRVSAAGRAADPLEFVFLVSTVRHVIAIDPVFALADGNAEASATRFATTREDAERMLYRLRAESDSERLHNAELLVAGRLPLESVTLIGVANDKVRATVRDVLAGSDFTPKISVYPPWFQQPE